MLVAVSIDAERLALIAVPDLCFPPLDYAQPNGNQLKIWECYPFLTQQRWFFSKANNTIKLFDVPYGPFGKKIRT
jgi:hypothetical protein